MEGMLLAREDVTDKHVMTSFAAIIGLACTLGVPAYISYWYMTTYQQIAFCAVSVPLLIYALAKWIREQNALAERRVMLVLASYDEKAKDGMSRYDANEAIAVANSFEFAGIQVVYASVQGGKCMAVRGMMGIEGDDDTLPIARCPAKDFVGLYCVGGSGAAHEWLKGCPPILQTRMDEILKQGGAVGACAAGAAALGKYVKDDKAREPFGLFYFGSKDSPLPSRKELKQNNCQIIVGAESKDCSSYVAGGMIYSIEKNWKPPAAPPAAAAAAAAKPKAE